MVEERNRAHDDMTSGTTATSGARSTGAAAAGAGGGSPNEVRWFRRTRAQLRSRASKRAAHARAQTLVVFVKREGAPTFVEVLAPAGASVAALLKLIAQELKLDASLDAVTLTKYNEDTPLDSRMTVQEALGGVVRPSLIVKVLKVERAPGA
jgi:hypothetical protein